MEYLIKIIESAQKASINMDLDNLINLTKEIEYQWELFFKKSQWRLYSFEELDNLRNSIEKWLSINKHAQDSLRKALIASEYEYSKENSVYSPQGKIKSELPVFWKKLES
jgi:hypothetical protein